MLKAERSKDMRIMTSFYELNGTSRFCIAEPTKLGTLITEFFENGEVARQKYIRSSNTEQELVKFLGEKVEITDTQKEYNRVKVKARCSVCGGEIARELDLKAPSEIENVPVVPLFVCTACNTKFYNMTDEMLKSLVAEHEDLFEKDEIEEKSKDEEAFIETLQANIIRIFASKKIYRLKTS